MSDDLVPQEPSKTRRQRGPMAHTPEEILGLRSKCDLMRRLAMPSK